MLHPLENIPNTPVENVLTIDIEDWFHILDVDSIPSIEDWHKLESTVAKNTQVILDLLHKYDTKGTFFVLGWVAEYFPDLVRQIAKQGHEIATHGYSHELIYNLTPNEFRRDVARSLDVLERITSRPILGYRAPGFSIANSSLWALDILVELGLQYDASIFPMNRNHGGLPGFSGDAAWLTTSQGNKILEIPVTPTTVFNKKVYLFGGGYFRLAPYSAIAAGIEQLNNQGKPALVYLHPREFDPQHPKLKMNPYRSFTSYVNLHKTYSKFERMIQDFQFNSIDKIWQVHIDPKQQKRVANNYLKVDSRELEVCFAHNNCGQNSDFAATA
ncbi:MAG: polysaccharide deacetylase family protein [Microcoleus sp. PH2017_22_RUC_O_B]|uniref:XrtA system polysaccharide deacetylase n=1 Tax=unclassified Microcoleus TaxID=2642155 RepID=UPI001D867C01|nr:MULTISPECIES: XrtA system polysaccharide deacetylase [unclassified Microcoleus]MCC3526538.1 polysaccharide deacetylase family protein [Microcoleus sp. PH2017_21_RUC_O_A]MCC3538834.1 polysaccharide deacetylase family protein [Microcoleus sp. PH2017_22_RUC_O_B]